MKKPFAKRPVSNKKNNSVFHEKISNYSKLIGKGPKINLRKIRDLVKASAKKEQAKQNEIARISGYKLEDFLLAFGRPDVVGSKGFLTWRFQPKSESNKGERIVLIGGVAVPEHQRRKGNRIELHNELFRLIYKRFGKLVKSDKNVFVQTQISASDTKSLHTLQRRLGYAIVFQEHGVIVLRKKLDSIEMNKLLKNK